MAHSVTRRHLLRQFAVLGTYALMPEIAEAKKKHDSEEDIFAKPRLLEVKLSISPAGEDSLRKQPREWVQAAATVDGNEISGVKAHLKGQTSFVPLDKKPSFTLTFNGTGRGARILGLRKFHLNNSVQDSSYLCERLSSELFDRAGVPCPRAAWAKVSLNGRKLGLYVLKESFTTDFLRRHFQRIDGNFYDGGLHHDIWEPLKLDSGDGPKDDSDLKALFAATQIAEPGARWGRLQALVDMKRFVSMMAMESLTCHIDGYSLMQNNYRIYFEPPSGRAVFVALGMDRMFETPQMPVEPEMRGVVSKAILGVADGRRMYRQRMRELAGKVFVAEWMDCRIDEGIALLKPAEPLVEPQANALRQRIMTRVALVKKWMSENPAT